jgi:hypothetical protein
MGIKTQMPAFEPVFLSLFFPNVITFESEEIAFDKITKKVKLAPFVSPMVAGRANKQQGGKLLSFAPAYVKPTDIVRPNQLLKRRAGEPVGGNLSPAQRRLAVVTQLLNDQEESIVHREEWMAVQAVMTGKVVVEGQDFPTQEVDFQRNANNNVVLSGAAKWDTVDPATYDPTDDLEDWAALASGSVDVIIMDKAAWRKFSKFQAVKDRLNTNERGGTSGLQLGPQASKTIMRKGYFGEFEIIVYVGKYTDSTSGLEVDYMPANTLLMAPKGYDGTRAYGAIQDAEAIATGTVATTRHPKNWFTKDPSVENLQTQSAPLMVTPDPDAFVAVTLF